MDTGSTFYLLMVDGEISVFVDAKSAIKSLRNMLKANLTLRPQSVVILIVDLSAVVWPAKGALKATEMPMAEVVRGLTWADADYPAVWP